MFKRAALIFLAVVVPAIALAKANTVVGVLTRVDPASIEVRTDDQKTVSLTLAADTTYRKWIMAKPWQQDSSAKARDLNAGTRVRIDVKPDNPQAAHMVWIVVR